MKSLFVILAGLGTCWTFSQLGSESVLTGVLAPLGVLLFLIALALWLVLKAGFGGSTSSSDIGGPDIGGGGE